LITQRILQSAKKLESRQVTLIAAYLVVDIRAEGIFDTAIAERQFRKRSSELFSRAIYGTFNRQSATGWVDPDMVGTGAGRTIPSQDFTGVRFS
jgi:hypothetical protein